MEEEVDLLQSFDDDVFESNFIFWNELPAHIKIAVLQYVSYPTLRNFMFLSKDCYTLASTVVTEAYAVFLHDLPFVTQYQDVPVKETSAEIVVYYIPPESKGIPDSHKSYQLSFFEDKNEGCFVKRVKERRGTKVVSNGFRYSNETVFSAAMRVFFKLTKSIKAEKLAIEIHSVSPEVESVLREQPGKTSLSCETFTVWTEDRRLPPLLIPLLTPGCKLQVYSNPFPERGDIFMDSAFFDLDVVREAPSFDTEALTGVTEDQFLLLRGGEISMKAPYISSKETGKQWFEEKRVIEFISLRETKPLNHDDVLDGIDVANILSWNEILAIPHLREQWEGDPKEGFHAGVRNMAGALIIISMGSDYCDLVASTSDMHF